MKTLYKSLIILAASALSFQTAAYADEPLKPGDPGYTPDGLVIGKSVKEISTNQYQVDLEAYVTGVTTHKNVKVPVDIMLVLDISGSMDERITSSNATAVSGPFNYSNTNNANLRVLYNGSYYPVTAHNGTTVYYLYYRSGTNTKYLSGEGTTDTQPTQYTSPSQTIYSNTVYYRQGNWRSKGTLSYNEVGGWRTYYYTSAYTYPIYRGTSTIQDGYYLTFTDGDDNIHYLFGDQILDSKPDNLPTSADGTIYNGPLYQVGTSTKTKIEILKDAVNKFIDTIATEAKGEDESFTGTEDNVSHRIGIATYEGLGDISYYLTTIDSDEVVSDLHKEVNGLSTGSGTCSDLGLAWAVDQFKNNPIASTENRSRVVVMFTDGEPYPGSKRDDFPYNWRNYNDTARRQWVANNAISISKTLKNTYKATCYSIGIFDSNVADWCYSYMHYITSEYPNATSLTEHGDRSGTKEYMQTSDGSDLSDIFQDIAEESTKATIELDEETVIKDVLSADFRLPNGASANDIHVYFAAPVGSTGEGDNIQYTFAPEAQWTTATGVTPSVNSATKTVSVTGFDFAENPVSKVTDKSGNVSYTGKKLIIRFNVEIDPTSAGGALVATNDPSSGIVDSEGNTIAWFEVPHAKIPNILIIKTGMHEGESAIFNVHCEVNDKYTDTGTIDTAPVNDIRVVVTCTKEGEVGVGKIKIQKPGRYTVTETAWSWAYGLTGVSNTISGTAVDDNGTITEAQWNEKGYGTWSEANKYLAKIPETKGTAYGQDGKSITRNVNDFTESSVTYTTPSGSSRTFNGTLFVFKNSENANNPAHAESLETNEFYVSGK